MGDHMENGRPSDGTPVTERGEIRPLAGLRVLDLSSAPAGFQASQVLADFGAEVVHVEPPGGSPLRTAPSYPFLARGKRSIVLDLADGDDRAVAVGLAEGADVLIETFRPGVIERLGLGYETLRAANPGLVFASITGFPRSGPDAATKGYEALVLARIGGLATSGGMVERPGPAHVSVPWGSYGAAQTAVVGTLAALHERQRGGVGQRVDTSLVQGIAGQGPYNWFIKVITDKFPDAFTPHPPFSERGVPESALSFMLLIGLTKDGRWVQFAQVQPHLFRALITAMDLDWMYDDARWKTLPVFEDEEQRSEFWDILLEAVRARTLAEWETVFAANHDIWAETLRHGAELLDHAQIRHLGAVVEIDDAERGRVRQPAALVRMDRTPAMLDRGAPRLDEHGAALRAKSWEALPAASMASRATGGASRGNDGLALEGVTVLELGTFYAAPYGATVFADLGARVVKLEPHSGDPLRHLLPFPEAGGAKAVQGKESIALDLGMEEGRAVVHDLVRQADIVLVSYRAGVAERQGVDEATLRAINPDIVYLTSPGYGADGPCGDRPAYAPSIGAGAGLTRRNLGSTLPERDDLTLEEIRACSRRISGAGTNEYAQADGIAALSVATAMMLGLVIRDRTGIAQGMLTTMLTSAAYALCDDLTLYEGRPDTMAPDGELLGYCARYRLYEAADGWVFLAAPQEREWKSLVAALAEDVDLAADPRLANERSRVEHDEGLAEVLAKVFATRGVGEWEERMRAHDVGCVAVDPRSPEAVLQSAEFGRASGLIVDVEHPTFGEHPRLTPLVSLSRSGGVTGAGCLVGQHTDQVLASLGYDEERIRALHESGVVA